MDDRPLRGGFTGILLVALATAGVAATAAVLIALILWLLG